MGGVQLVDDWRFSVVARPGTCGMCGGRLQSPRGQGFCSITCMVDAERVRLIMDGWKCDSYTSVADLVRARNGLGKLDEGRCNGRRGHNQNPNTEL